MNQQFMQKIEERLIPLHKRIEKLEQDHITQGVDAIKKHHVEVGNIMREIDVLDALAMQAGDAFSRKVERKLKSLALRLQLLPQVPPIEAVRLVQSIFALKPLVLSTDSIIDEETGQPELARIFLMEATEVPRFDYSFAPSWHDAVHILELNTIEKATDTPTPRTSLEIAWSEFHKTIYGRYLVAFDLPLTQIQLCTTAQIHGLPVPMLVGHSLLDLLFMYVGVKEPFFYEIDGPRLSLTDSDLRDLMEREDVISLYDSSLTSADQRSRHLLHVMQKIADGMFSLQ